MTRYKAQFAAPGYEIVCGLVEGACVLHWWRPGTTLLAAPLVVRRLDRLRAYVKSLRSHGHTRWLRPPKED